VFSATRVGWTLGGGLEWMFMPNWMARLEYLHYDLGSVTYNPGTRTSFDPAFVLGPLYQHVSTATATFRYDVVRVGLNYQFGYFQ
jgi:outer membrane immunogenic protein